MKKTPIILIILIIIILLTLFLVSNKNQSIKNPSEVTINNQIFTIETATTSLERSQGLMFRSHLNQNAGMLFIFDDENPRSFWMKNTLIPLDIIFINSNNEIIDIKHNFQPCKTEVCESYTSTNPAKYVLEINKGLAKELEIEIGQKVNIE